MFFLKNCAENEAWRLVPGFNRGKGKWSSA